MRVNWDNSYLCSFSSPLLLLLFHALNDSSGGGRVGGEREREREGCNSILGQSASASSQLLLSIPRESFFFWRGALEKKTHLSKNMFLWSFWPASRGFHLISYVHLLPPPPTVICIRMSLVQNVSLHECPVLAICPPPPHPPGWTNRTCWVGWGHQMDANMYLHSRSTCLLSLSLHKERGGGGGSFVTSHALVQVTEREEEEFFGLLMQFFKKRSECAKVQNHCFEYSLPPP